MNKTSLVGIAIGTLATLALVGVGVLYNYQTRTVVLLAKKGDFATSVEVAKSWPFKSVATVYLMALTQEPGKMVPVEKAWNPINIAVDEPFIGDVENGVGVRWVAVCSFSVIKTPGDALRHWNGGGIFKAAELNGQVLSCGQ